ncbi:hypothetical protein ABBQ32_010799 [Trebouxia sp. C0010 RCD-2024]
MAPSTSGGAKKRSHAWSEKNRRAQQRFRDRQKAHKHELEQQIAEKQAAAEALQAEHAGLKGQHTMLAMLLDTQQSAVNILQEQEQVAVPCGTDFSRQRSSQPKQLPQKEAEPLLLSLLQGHTQQPSPSGPATYLDQDDDYCKTYAVLVEDLQQLLARLEAEPSSSELQLELQNQTRAAGYCMKQALLMNPDNMKDLLAGNSEGLGADPTHSYFTCPRDWQAVTECLQMTAEQKQQIMQLRGSFLEEQAHHQAQWRLLCQCMNQGKDPVKAEAYREALKQTPNGFYRRQLYVLEVNLRQQQAMWVDLHHSIFYEVWSPQQCARAIVESGLHYVDALAIANCVAQQLSGDHGAL